MPRSKATPARREGASTAGVGDSGSSAEAQTKITLRIRHAGGMARLVTETATTIRQVKELVSMLDVILADPVKMLLYKEGDTATELPDSATVASVGLAHGDIVRMRLSKPKARTEDATGEGPESGAAVGSEKRKAESNPVAAARKKPRQRATVLASGWSAEQVAVQLIHAGAGAQGTQGARAADQFAQAHRMEAVDKGQIKEVRTGSTLDRVLTYTHRNRDDERFTPLDLPALAAVVAAVFQKVRTKRRSNHDTARAHLNVSCLAGTAPTVFWSLWIAVTENETADAAASVPATKSSMTTSSAMQALMDQLIADELAALKPTDMPLGLNV